MATRNNRGSNFQRADSRSPAIYVDPEDNGNQGAPVAAHHRVVSTMFASSSFASPGSPHLPSTRLTGCNPSLHVKLTSDGTVS